MQTKNQPELVYLTNDSGQATGYVRIPGQAGHRFQTKVDTDSGASWTAIPREGGH